MSRLRLCASVKRFSSFYFLRRRTCAPRKSITCCILVVCYFSIIFVLTIKTVAKFGVKKTESKTAAKQVSTAQLFTNARHPEAWINERTALSNEKPLDVIVRQLLKVREKIKPGKFKIRGEETTFNMSDWASIQFDRQQRVSEICQGRQHHYTHSKNPEFGEIDDELDTIKKFWNRLEVYKEQNFVFCPALKVASTFWKRVLYALQNGMSIFTPFEIPIKVALNADRRNLYDFAQKAIFGVHSASDPKLSINLAFNGTSAHQFLQKFGSVMFTREPYSKVLSGYVDKLYAPNPYYWETVGRKIILTFRKNPSPTSLLCGHDVTFSEYIQYIVYGHMDGDKQDRHFATVFDQCKPCDTNYDVIGKFETFNQDTSLVLALLGSNVSQSTLAHWNYLAEKDAIFDSITSPYGWHMQITKCISWQEANYRIWRKLQIRGIIHKEQPFPPEAFSRMWTSPAMMIDLIKPFWLNFRRSGLKIKQKKEALASAYSLVPKYFLEKLRDHFLIDFDIFDYDSKPASVFSGRNTWDVFNFKT